MQTHGPACKLMDLYAFLNILEHSAYNILHAFRNILHAFWNILEHASETHLQCSFEESDTWMDTHGRTYKIPSSRAPVGAKREIKSFQGHSVKCA